MPKKSVPISLSEQMESGVVSAIYKYVSAAFFCQAVICRMRFCVQVSMWQFRFNRMIVFVLNCLLWPKDLACLNFHCSCVILRLTCASSQQDSTHHCRGTLNPIMAKSLHWPVWKPLDFSPTLGLYNNK